MTESDFTVTLDDNVLDGVARLICGDDTDYYRQGYQSDVLRAHRNLVHPKKQWTESYTPGEDVVRIAWQVVVAALNDLAALPPRG